MRNRIEEKIAKFIKEEDVSMVVDPALNVDRDRATWLKKGGFKDVEGLSEEKKLKPGDTIHVNIGGKGGHWVDYQTGMKVAQKGPHTTYFQDEKWVPAKFVRKYSPDRPGRQGETAYVVKIGGREQEFAPHAVREGRMDGDQAEGIFEADEKVTCPKCSGSGKVEGKPCSICRGSKKISRNTWEKHYGNPATAHK